MGKRRVYFQDGMEGFSVEDEKEDLGKKEGRSRKKSWKGFETKKMIWRGGEEKTGNKGVGEILRKEGFDRLREKKESKKKRKTENKERRDHFREWRIQEENK